MFVVNPAPVFPVYLKYRSSQHLPPNRPHGWRVKFMDDVPLAGLNYLRFFGGRHGSAMEQLNVHPRILAALKNAKLTNYVTILSMSGPDVARATGLSAADVAILHKVVAQSVPRPDCTTGGLLTTGITEVSGESASGKTQICMQLCLTVQLPISLGGLNSGALYICTEDAFPNKRLYQMAQYFKHSRQEPEVKNIAFMDQIFVEHCADLEDLNFCIMQKAPVLLNRGAAKLVIVDSIAALFRCDYRLEESAKRAKEISTLGMQLHRLSHLFNVPIVCVNQVTAVVNRTGTNSERFQSSKVDSGVKPSLGLTWANLVTTRLMLSRVPGRAYRSRATKADGTEEQTLLPLRAMEIMFAPHLPSSVCQYIVHAGGVSGIDF